MGALKYGGPQTGSLSCIKPKYGAPQTGSPCHVKPKYGGFPNGRPLLLREHKKAAEREIRPAA
jgi:hypothetical protein